MIIVTDENRSKYVELNKTHPKGHFAQSPEWAKVKDNWKNEVILSLDSDGKAVGALSVLIRKVPFFNRTIMYAPRAPVCDVHNEEVMTDLIGGVRELANKYRAYVFKMDPDVLKSDMLFAEIVKKLGFKTQGGKNKNFEGIQPGFVFRLNIEGKTQDEIFAQFHSKTRYNIRVAQKNNVETFVGTYEDLPRFHEIMCETGARDRFVIRSLEYFQKMYRHLAPENLRLYMARHENKIIAGTLAIYYGDKVWYLYGASSNSARNVMPNYLLQWEMIKWALEKNCRIYDFRGVSGDIDESNPLYGLYRFKKGFSGDLCEFIGEMDLVFDPVMNLLITKGEPIFREVRRLLFLLIKRK